MNKLLAVVAVLLLLVGGGVFLSAFIVNQNEQALVLRFGEYKRTVQEPGLHFRTPVLDNVEYYDKRILDLDLPPQEVNSFDQKRLVVDAFVRYRIHDPLAYFRAIRTERRLREQLGAVVRDGLGGAVSRYQFLDIVKDKREAIMAEIAKQVDERAKRFGVDIVDVRIKRADLPEQNSKFIYERMRAERQREAAEFRAFGTAEANRIKGTADREVTIIKAEATRKSEQIKGEGDGERNRIFAEAFNRDPGFFAFYRSMQAYEQAMKSGDTRLVISPNSDFFRYFNDPNGGTPDAAAAPPAPKR